MLSSILLFAGVVILWAVIIVTASLLAVIPFWLVGLAGEVVERHWKGAGLREDTREEGPADFTEEGLWLESKRSRASLFESPGEEHRRAA